MLWRLQFTMTKVEKVEAKNDLKRSKKGKKKLYVCTCELWEPFGLTIWVLFGTHTLMHNCSCVRSFPCYDFPAFRYSSVHYFSSLSLYVVVNFNINKNEYKLHQWWALPFDMCRPCVVFRLARWVSKRRFRRLGWHRATCVDMSYLKCVSSK